jgi:hypothetical protein
LPAVGSEGDYAVTGNNITNRFHKSLLIATCVPLCWLWMQVVHEFGHVAAAWATGGTVSEVVLHPLTVSRTDLSDNPHPLAVVWAGPLLGAALPLLIAGVAGVTRQSGAHLAAFFAGFCLIANGLYIGVGSFQGVGDAGDMLRHGSPIWSLWLFGLVTAPLGLALWNGLGPHFGLGNKAGKVSPWAAYLSCALLAVTVILEVTLSTH